MEFIEDEDFNELISNFKNLSLSEKKELTISEVKSLIAVLHALNIRKNSEFKTLFNREVIDLNNENYAESDFVEAIYVYIYSIKESLADLISNLTDDLK